MTTRKDKLVAHRSLPLAARKPPYRTQTRRPEGCFHNRARQTGENCPPKACRTTIFHLPRKVTSVTLKGTVPVTYKHFPGVAHEFFGMGAVLEKANRLALAGSQLKQSFRTQATSRERSMPAQ